VSFVASKVRRKGWKLLLLNWVSSCRNFVHVELNWFRTAGSRVRCHLCRSWRLFLTSSWMLFGYTTAVGLGGSLGVTALAVSTMVVVNDSSATQFLLCLSLVGQSVADSSTKHNKERANTDSNTYP